MLPRWLDRGARRERRAARRFVLLLRERYGMSGAEARASFRAFYRQAERELAASPERPGPRHGDRLLELESSDESAFLYLARRRDEGVTDDDVRAWWNLEEIERRILRQADEKQRFGILIHHIKAGMTEAEAAERVRKELPIYGDPDDARAGTGDDRPLPDELRDRVERLRRERYRADPGAFLERLERASSFNALARALLREEPRG